MGKARIKLDWGFVKDFLQLPDAWQPHTCYLSQYPTWDEFGHIHTRYEINFVVEGENIKEQDPPLDLVGQFKAKTLDNAEGRWVQGHWEVFR